MADRSLDSLLKNEGIWKRKLSRSSLPIEIGEHLMVNYNLAGRAYLRLRQS
jgi:hypothetical protein